MTRADALTTPEAQAEAASVLKELERVRARCRAQLETSWVTPMGSEMYYRFQEQMTEDAIAALTTLISRSKVPA